MLGHGHPVDQLSLCPSVPETERRQTSSDIEQILQSFPCYTTSTTYNPGSGPYTTLLYKHRASISKLEAIKSHGNSRPTA
jgi:hypothetical protein